MTEETVEIPLRNRKKEIVGHAIISKADEELVGKHRWHLTGDGKYAQSGSNRKCKIRMHQLILGKAEKGYVIDHLDNNGFNNTRMNLRFVSFSLNSQNKKKKSETSSKFIGVTKTNNTQKPYKVSHKGVCYGQYKDEETAAKKYDSIVLILSNGKAKTNNLVTYKDVKDKNIDDIVSIKRKKEPKYIILNKNLYFVAITYKGIRLRKSCIKTLDEAKSYLENFKQKIELLKETEKNSIFNLPIKRL